MPPPKPSLSNQFQPLSSQPGQTSQTSPTTKSSYAMIPIKPGQPTTIPSSSSSLKTTIPRLLPLSQTDWYTQLMEEEEAQAKLSSKADKSFAQTVATQTSKEVATRPSSSSMVTLGPIPSASKNVVVSTNPTPLSQISPNLKSSYFIEPQIHLITDLQQEIQNSFHDLQLTHAFLLNRFLPDQYFISSNPIKTQRFYEFILVDTDSVSIKHYQDKFDQSQNAYSTCQILRILTIDDWDPIQINPVNFPSLLYPLPTITGIIKMPDIKPFITKIKHSGILGCFIFQTNSIKPFQPGLRIGGPCSAQPLKSLLLQPNQDFRIIKPNSKLQQDTP